MLYGNYQYSLSGADQSAIQIWLRMLPKHLRQSWPWQLLHQLSYAQTWTDTPRFPLAEKEEVEKTG